MKKVAYYADHLDIHRHLASEELILNDLETDTMVLYLWSAADAMVIGKNQNPWLECNLPLMEAKACGLARRISGGGAVFHDAGNLNYSVFMPRDDYDRDSISELVLEALKTFGIEGNVGARHLLEVKGNKFSGNAFCIRHDKVLHHGTLLINADLEKLVDYAAPTCAGIEAKGIRSVPSTVGNLSDTCPGLTCSVVKEAIFTIFNADSPPVLFCHGALEGRTSYFQSDAWRFHRTPRFVARGTLHGSHVAFEAEIVKGLIKRFDAGPGGDSLQSEFVDMDFRTFLEHKPELSLE